MKLFRLILLAVVGTLLWAALALAYECEYQNITTKKNRVAGVAVINQVDNYCGQVTKQGGGFKVKIDGKKAEYYDSSHSYEDVLQYVCNKCGLKSTPRLSGKP